MYTALDTDHGTREDLEAHNSMLFPLQWECLGTNEAVGSSQVGCLGTWDLGVAGPNLAHVNVTSMAAQVEGGANARLLYPGINIRAQSGIFSFV